LPKFLGGKERSEKNVETSSELTELTSMGLPRGDPRHHRALEGERPFDRLDTDAGVRSVEQVPGGWRKVDNQDPQKLLRGLQGRPISILGKSGGRVEHTVMTNECSNEQFVNR
jgi:hypothetical protein